MYYFYKGEEKFVKGVFYIQYTAIMTEQRHKLGNNILHGIFATLLRTHHFINEHSLHSQSFEIES